MVGEPFVAKVIGIPHLPSITTVNVRSGPSMKHVVVSKVQVGVAQQPILDVQDDSEQASLNDKVYKWFKIQFSNGAVGWLRDDLIEIEGDGTKLGFASISEPILAHQIIVNTSDSTTAPAVEVAEINELAKREQIMQEFDEFDIEDKSLIFVSYSRRDYDEFVKPMVDRLIGEGLNIWLDKHLLEGGDDWMDEINQALKYCNRMILCISPDSLQSRFVKMEYRYFFNNEKKLYPLICRDVDELTAELQVIQFFNYKDLDNLIPILKNESKN